ncbi:phage Gp37/Gp68 family protein [Frankia sp. R82]|nr:phage Gp37/Gp68 family protein [Frankia sp. R82]MCM3884136.1 phage Gp37/Gp68 family protein [Frankia sp. R82]
MSFTDTPAVGQNRVWEEGVVEAVWETEKPTVEFELANGARAVASEDHKWLIAKRGASQWWRSTVDLTFKTPVRTVRLAGGDLRTSTDYRAGYIAGVTAGDGTFRWDSSWRSDKLGFPQSYWRVAKPESDRVVLDRLVDYLSHFEIDVAVRPFDSGPSVFTDNPVPMAKVETRRLAHMPLIAGLCEERPTTEWMTGWLAGMFDTDASYTGGNLRFHQAKPNDVLDMAVRFAKELGFELKREDYSGGCPGARLVGGIPENIAFLAAISPAMTRRCQDFYGRRVETEDHMVVGVRRGPVRRLVDITVSTGTFVAEGMLTHNCYAATIAHRFAGTKAYPNGFNITVHPERLTAPLRRRKPTTYFVNSMGDVFHDDVPDEAIVRMWAVMAATPQHTYIVLTKRHGRMRSFLRDECRCGAGHQPGIHLRSAMDWASTPHSPTYVPGIEPGLYHRMRWPLPNVWLGVSAEDQRTAELRIPALLATPAAVRVVSAEPLLGPVDLTRLKARNGAHIDALAGDVIHPVTGEIYAAAPGCIDWVIVGGESGHRARPMHPLWARGLRDQTTSRGRAFFFKQWGSWGPAQHKVPVDPELVERWAADRGDPALVAELNAAKAASEAVGATHGYAVWADQYGWQPHEYSHRPWSVERSSVDESMHASIRRWGVKAAGRELDGRVHDDMPARHAPAGAAS